MRHMRMYRRSACVVAFILSFGLEARAQSFTGGLRGAVKESDRIIPGVTVTLVNEATGISRETVSNETGEYAFAAVTPGSYEVRATLEGFKTFERKGLTIGTQQFITLDLVMEVGAITESITVQGTAPLVETSNASTGLVLDKETLEALPTLNRNAYITVTTVPTVLAQGNPRLSRLESQTTGSLLSMGGGPLRANNYLLDGVSTTDLQNRTSVFVAMEAVEEVKVQVHTYDAEMGRSGGGVFNTTGRSGSNTFKGSGFYQERPNWAAMRRFFDERSNAPKDTKAFYRYWGGSFGGPIKRNKTFFWAAHEGYRTRASFTDLLYLPTTRELAGDFSQSFDRNGKLVVIYDPWTTTQLPDGTFTRTQFPGNVIPANRLNPVALKIASFLPTPDEQRSAADGRANKQLTNPGPTVAEQYVFKGEHKVTDNNSLTALYLYQNNDWHYEFTWGGKFNSFAEPRNYTEARRVHILALNDTMILSPRTVMTLRYGWTRFDDFHNPYSGYDLASLGFPQSFVNAVTFQKFPSGTIEGYPNPGGVFGNGPHDRDRYKSWMANGSVSTLVGRHTFKYGADFRRIGVDSLTIGAASGSFNFTKAWTQASPFVARTDQGSGFATFLLGIPAGTTPVSAPVNVFSRYYGAYFQDDFRVSQSLTLNVGLRYEYEGGLRETENRFTVAFDSDVVSPIDALVRKTGTPLEGTTLRGGLRYAGQDGFPDYQGDPSKTKFSPRVGMAWTLGLRTVLRGGYGLFWSPYVYTAAGTANFGQIGYTQTNQILQANNLIPTVTLSNPYPNGLEQPVGNTLGLLTGAGGPIDYVWQHRKDPYVQQYSADFQRELPGNMALSVGYVGARGDNLNYGGSSADYVNINTLTAEQMALGAKLQEQVPNPFFGVREAGGFSVLQTIARGQLLRPYPQFDDIRQRQTSGSRLRYNAAVLQLDKRLTHGVSGRFHYTWSRLDDDQFGQGNGFSNANQGGRPLDNRSLAAEYSRSLRDIPHRVIVSPIVELPFGTGRRWATSGLSNVLAGDWTLSAIYSYESGSPINIIQADNTGSFGGVQRPILTDVSPVTAGSTIDRLDDWINPAAYRLAAPFTRGTAPRTDPRISTHARTNVDFVAAKKLSLRGRMRAELRVDVLNVTNTPQFEGPAARVGDATFGQILTQANYSRLAQFTFRVLW